jgi:RES domain-containing protein
MSLTAWRIVQARHFSSALDGEGARRFPGRWNHRRTPMVYTAGSLALAALEMLVNMDADQLRDAYLAFPLTFDEALCRRIAAHQLPPEWSMHPIPAATRDIGTAWIQSKASPVLAVPSAVIPIETNFLLNPLHPEFVKIHMGDAASFNYDPRLVKKETAKSGAARPSEPQPARHPRIQIKETAA